MRAMKWIFLLLLTLAVPAKAKDPEFRPQWTAQCKFRGTNFSVHFASPSGQAERDDQTVTLAWGKKSSVLPVEPALFESMEFVSDAANHCRGIGAFEWPGHKLLLLIPRNNRPSDDEVMALVIDPSTGKLVENAGVIGTPWSPAIVLRQGAGVRVLLERSWHADVNHGGEFAAPGWMLLSEEGGHLVHRWESER